MERLTHRQLDIARLVARGYSTPQIARELSLAEQTVKTYLWDIYAAMGWTNDAGNQRVLLARLVWEQGEGQKTAAERGKMAER